MTDVVLIEFTCCVWCDQPLVAPHAVVSEPTSIGKVTGLVCESCDARFNKQPTTEDQ